MTDIRKCAQAVISRYDNALEIDTHCDLADPIEALRQALATPVEPVCNPHPDAPHGFNRNASHTEDRYVCDCESWDPPSVDALIAEAVAKEREACAQLCIQMGTEPMEWQPSKLGIRPEHWDVAQAIRARGQK